MNCKRPLAYAIAVMVLLSSLIAFTGGTIASDSAQMTGAADLDITENTYPATGWTVVEHDVPSGSGYFLWEEHGGWWSDAEKVPGDDGKMNPAPDNPGDEDDLLCWAAAASNMLEYTGWGFVGGMDTPDEFLDYFEDHVTDNGSAIEYGIEWWFNGNLPWPGANWSNEDVPGGDFWDIPHIPSLYTFVNNDDSMALLQIEANLRLGLACGIGINPVVGDGGHAITVWGINVDTSIINPLDNARYKGIWVSDSDSHKHLANAEDHLTYFSVNYEDGNFWNMTNYGGGWRISAVVGLAPFPLEDRPTADVRITETGEEGSRFVFNASHSSDPDNIWDGVDDLTYRWDFDGDGTWDTGWSSDPEVSHTWYDDYQGTVYLQVFDGRLTDMDSIDVVVLNVAPAITSLSFDAEIDENDVLSLVIDLTDPGTEDTFVVTVDWGDGTVTNHDVGKGVRTLTVSHRYLDDDPTATPSDVYTIDVTVVDKDGGSGSSSDVLTVRNVVPIMMATGDSIDENGIATVSGTITDPGTEDTFTLVITWGDGQTNTYLYPKGTITFSETHQYLDDDPSGTPWDDYTVTLTITDDDTGTSSTTATVTVSNLDPVTSIDRMDQPNSEFILPVIHTLDFHGSFTDVGTLDTHTAIWDWGDGTSDVGTVIEAGGSGMVTGSHVYLTPGTYIVTLTVTDDDTGYSIDTFEVVVVDAHGALDIMNEYIQSLPDEAFGKNADKKKNALEMMINALHDMVDEGDFNGAIQDMQSNMLSKVDGFMGGNPKDDWIIDPVAQEELAQKLNDICQYLALFL